MAISNPVKNAAGNWVVTINQDGSQASKTLSTKNTYVDGDIVLNEPAATQIVFGNQPATGKQASSYTTIDDEAPVLISGDYLYVNEGYRGDVKISLAKLVPDGSDVAGHGDYILKGHSAYDNAGTLVAGTIETRTPSTTYYTSSDTGYGRIDIGYIANAVSIKMGDLNPTATVATQDTALTSPSSIDKQYVKITPKDIPTTAGWVTTDGETGTVLNYKVKDGSYDCTVEGAITATATADSANMDTIAQPSGTEGTDYFSFTATPHASGTVSGYAEITGAGWLPTGQKSGGSKSGTEGAGDKKYVAKAVITNNTTLPSGKTSSGDINRGSYIKIAAGYNKTDLYYRAKPNSGNVTITQQTGQSVDGYATASVQAGSATPNATLTGATGLTGTVDVNTKQFTVTPTASVGTAGWISSIANGTVQKYEVLSGSASGTATVEGSSSALTSPTAMNNQYFKVTPGGTVSQEGWISSISAGTTLNYKVKDGTATGSATVAGSSSALTSPSAMNYQYFTVTPSGSVSTPGWITSVGNGTQLKYKVKDGSVTPGATLTGATGLSSPIDVQSKQFTVTPNATVGTAGWVSSVGNGTVQNYEVISGSATPAATVNGSASALTGTTAMNNQYFTVTPTASVGQPGWISSISNGTQLKYKVKDGAAKVNATNVAVTTTLTGAVNTTDNVYRVTASSTGSTTVTGTATTAGWISSVTSATVGITGGDNELNIPLYTGEVA